MFMPWKRYIVQIHLVFEILSLLELEGLVTDQNVVAYFLKLKSYFNHVEDHFEFGVRKIIS
jgi:hypothetical protein